MSMLSEFAVGNELGPMLPGSQLCQTRRMLMEGGSESRKEGEGWCLAERQEGPWCAVCVFSKDSEDGCFWLRIQGKSVRYKFESHIAASGVGEVRFFFFPFHLERISFPTAGTRFWATSNRNSQPSQFLRERRRHFWVQPRKSSRRNPTKWNMTSPTRRGNRFGVVYLEQSKQLVSRCIPGKEVEEGQEGPALGWPS